MGKNHNFFLNITLSAYYCNIKASQYCMSQTLIKTGCNFKVFIVTKLFCIFENHYAVSINSKLQLSKVSDLNRTPDCCPEMVYTTSSSKLRLTLLATLGKHSKLQLPL